MESTNATRTEHRLIKQSSLCPSKLQNAFSTFQRNQIGKPLAFFCTTIAVFSTW